MKLKLITIFHGREGDCTDLNAVVYDASDKNVHFEGVRFICIFYHYQPEQNKGWSNGKVRVTNESNAHKVNIITIITPTFF